MAVGVDRRRGRVHVAVLLEVGLERAHEVGRVLVVVLDDRRDRVLVERAHLLRVRGEHAEQQPVRCPSRCPRGSGRRRRRSGAGRRAPARPPGSRGRSRPGRRRTSRARRCRGAAGAPRACAPPPASPRARRRRRPPAAARRRAPRCRRPPAPCAARARPAYSPAIVATTWRGRSEVSSAHSTTAPRERSQPSRAARRTTSCGSRSVRARSSSRNEPRRFCSTSSLASSTATSVSDATAARCRNSSASGAGSSAPASSTRADRVVAGARSAPRRPRRAGTGAGAVAHPLGDVAPQRSRVQARARTPPPPPAAG